MDDAEIDTWSHWAAPETVRQVGTLGLAACNDWLPRGRRDGWQQRRAIPPASPRARAGDVPGYPAACLRAGRRAIGQGDKTRAARGA